ncbi:MAG: type II toxin-antitoxin system RelE/ParE family toxin [Bryobacteraceae bacterium]
MRLRFTRRADKDYADLPAAVRKAFAKQLGFLLTNLQHPSLHTKKYDESEQIWQARVNRSWRFYFKIVDDEYLILSIIPHPK